MLAPPMLWTRTRAALHLPSETCSCSDWRVAARCPGLWPLSWLYSLHWGWHEPCQHPRHLRPCCHTGRKNSWKANRNLGKERSSSERNERTRNCSSEWPGGIGSPRHSLRHVLPQRLASSSFNKLYRRTGEGIAHSTRLPKADFSDRLCYLRGI